jgi:murein DD-endopeptidase MepM/ murein hydrolase activator NlpD
MNKMIISIISLILAGMIGLVFYLNNENQQTNFSQIPDQSQQIERPESPKSSPEVENTDSQAERPSSFNPPLNRSRERVSKKPFGIYITPKNSPIQPERFQGYHTGADFEVFPNEQDRSVSVKAICSGSIATKKYANGYGGVLVQNCQMENKPITVVYGHLNLTSIAKSEGENLTQGDIIGELGKGLSKETDHERKHLHLGIHKGKNIDIRGYVPVESQLSEWIDPCLYACFN